MAGKNSFDVTKVTRIGLLIVVIYLKNKILKKNRICYEKYCSGHSCPR